MAIDILISPNFLSKPVFILIHRISLDEKLLLVPEAFGLGEHRVESQKMVPLIPATGD